MTDQAPAPDYRALVVAATRGDAAATDRLFARMLPAIRAFIRVRAGRVLRERESIEDLAQSVCREMLVDLGTFEYRGDAEIHGWIALLATRKILQRQRYYAQQRRDVAREVPPPMAAADAESLVTAIGIGPTPSQVAIAHEQARRIEQALATLPDNQRDAVTMSRLMGLPYKAIAEEIGCTEAAARGLTLRGLAAVAAALADRPSSS